MPANAVPSWRSRFRYVVDTTVNFFLPPVCASCQRVGSLLCEECRAALPWVRPPLCGRCGRSLTRAADECVMCRRRPLPLLQIRAALRYTGPVPSAIHALKYEGFFAMAVPLAELMVEAWPCWHSPVDVLVPVPLHPERERERGYNQAQLLTERLCRQMSLPVDHSGLKRIRRTRPQVGLSGKDRLDNVSGAFGAVRARIVGRRVLLVDDVYTSGATLAAAATALLEAGASGVSAYCLARAVDS